MTWAEAMERARERSRDTGRRWYVRGFRRTIIAPGTWLYSAYSEPFPPIVGRDWSVYGVDKRVAWPRGIR